MDNSFFEETFEGIIPEVANDGKWQIHLVRSHFTQIAIGASNLGLSAYERVWESGNILNFYHRAGSPCDIRFDSDYRTRFDDYGEQANQPNCYIALYADASKMRRESYYGGLSSIRPGRERLYAIVVWMQGDVRIVKYFENRGSITQSRYDGLNFIVSAYAHACGGNTDSLIPWESRQKKKVPGLVRQHLHKTVKQVEGLFGQGKDFFEIEPRPKIGKK